MDTSHESLNTYDSEWEKTYLEEEQKIRDVLGDGVVDIQHIGSTAVPGLASKSIIDIAVLLKSHTEAEAHIEPLKELGYMFDEVAHAKGPSPERHFFRKGNPTQFHLSLGYADKGSFWKRQILFRDYLRNHPDVRDEYQKIKEQGLTVDPSGMDAYIEHKTKFIFATLEKAGFVKTW